MAIRKFIVGLINKFQSTENRSNSLEIKYLGIMLRNPVINGFDNESMSIEEIEAMESRYNFGEKFPVAFREYLSIAGKFDNTGTNNFDIDLLQEYSLESLNFVGEKIERPFFVFSGLDACSQFHFIYLDETNEDPQVYTSYPLLMEDFNLPLIRKNDFTFVELVKENLRRKKLGISI